MIDFNNIKVTLERRSGNVSVAVAEIKFVAEIKYDEREMKQSPNFETCLKDEVRYALWHQIYGETNHALRMAIIDCYRDAWPRKTIANPNDIFSKVFDAFPKPKRNLDPKSVTT